MNNNRKKKTQTQTPGEERLKSFLDMIAPSVIQFYTDHYICGNTFRSVWALREYPTATDAVSYTHLPECKGIEQPDICNNSTADSSQLLPGILLRNLLAAFRENQKWIQCGL